MLHVVATAIRTEAACVASVCYLNSPFISEDQVGFKLLVLKRNNYQTVHYRWQYYNASIMPDQVVASTCRLRLPTGVSGYNFTLMPMAHSQRCNLNMPVKMCLRLGVSLTRRLRISVTQQPEGHGTVPALLRRCLTVMRPGTHC